MELVKMFTTQMNFAYSIIMNHAIIQDVYSMSYMYVVNGRIFQLVERNPGGDLLNQSAPRYDQ